MGNNSSHTHVHSHARTRTHTHYGSYEVNETGSEVNDERVPKFHSVFTLHVSERVHTTEDLGVLIHSRKVRGILVGV